MAHRVRSAWLGLASGAMLAMLVGCTGAEGPQGPAGTAGPEGPAGPAGQDATAEPSVSAITPNRAFLERSSQVTISGYGTRWETAPAVSFDGGGVTVDNVEVASPTSLIVDITVAADAAVGARNVIVGDGETAVTYEDAFNVEAPIELTALGGTTAQGSIILVGGKMVDVSTPFDTLLLDSDFFFLQVGDSSPWMMGEGDAAAYSFFNLAFVDVVATAGPTDVIISNGIDPIVSRAPAAFDVAARTPAALTAGTQVTDTVMNALESKLFTITTNPDIATVVWVTADSADASPAFALLPDTGRFEDMLNFGSSVTLPADPMAQTYYLVYWDNTGTTGYDITIGVEEQAPDEPDECQVAAPLAVPADLQGASLADETDEDWFAITVPASADGFRISVATYPGDTDTDTVLDIVGPNCTTLVAGPSADSGYHELLVSDLIQVAADTTYYVRVYNSSFGFTSPNYNLTVELLPNAPDAYEPNNDFASATTAASGGMYPATVAPADDLDYYAVMATMGQTITATITDGVQSSCGGPPGLNDSEVEILDSAGTQLAFNDDESNTNWCSVATATAPADGTYYIRAATSAQYCPGCIFDYTLLVDVQ